MESKKYPRQAEQNDQFELLVSDEDFRNCVRQGQEAAAMTSNRENLPESNYKPESGFDWEGQTLSLQGWVSCAPLFRRIVAKTTHVQVVASDPLPVTRPVDAHTQSLHALPLEERDCSLSWS